MEPPMMASRLTPDMSDGLRAQNFDEKAYCIRPPTQMMRLVDALRFHKPTDAEREELNLCSSTERISLHLLSDLLLVCGGRKGFRFTSAEIQHLRQTSDEVARRYDVLDAAFKGLSLDVTQYRFPVTVQRLEDDDEFATLRGDARAEVLSAPNSVRQRAVQFQWLARQYIDGFAALRDSIQAIRKRFDRFLNEEAVDASAIVALPEPVEVEFESKAHHPFPGFLHVLIQKYHREQRGKSTPWHPSCPEPPVESIGVFATFLACVLLDGAPLSVDELWSFQILLQVLKLSFRVDVSAMRIHDVVHSPDVTHDAHLYRVQHGVAIISYPLLSAMIYEFLSTVRELRLVAREKRLLPTPRTRKASRRSTEQLVA
ncbi:hypothetical protein PINS_up010392 [Pythium insidiosum]|nr:hypothetical protein PINS_up010392 [Pythium insidiosum]